MRFKQIKRLEKTAGLGFSFAKRSIPEERQEGWTLEIALSLFLFTDEETEAQRTGPKSLGF